MAKTDPEAVDKAADFLVGLADLLDAHPSIRLSYTTDDDGVHVDIVGVDACIMLGFSLQADSARAHADNLRLLARDTRKKRGKADGGN